MSGRPSKPTELIVIEGKTHLTKSEIEYRKQNEKALYTGENFNEIDIVKSNKIAHKEFLRLKRLYGKISFVDGLDEQIINRYCIEIATLQQAEKTLNELYELQEDTEELEKKIEIINLINKTITSINKSKELLLKYEDRLFLNPATRIKSVPKKPEKEDKKPTGIAAVMNKRAGL